MASLTDSLNWKCYSERELLRITAILEPIVKIYDEYLRVFHVWLSCTRAATGGYCKKKGVLKIFANFTGKHLSQSLFLIKLQPSFIKKETLTQHFPMNFAKL